MKIAITGCTGFIGGHLCRHLGSQGHSVLGIARGQGNDIRNAFSHWRPEVVVHLATRYLRDHRPEDIEQIVESNIHFGTRVLEAIRETGCVRFINMGTMWEHWHGVSYNPVNLYAATKRAFQDVVAWYQAVGAVDAITLKLHDTYGPDDRRRKLVSALIDAGRTGNPIEVSPGLQVLDLIHVEDVCRAIEYVATAPAPWKGVSFALSGERISLKGLVELIEDLMGRRIDAVWGARPYAAREVMQPASYGLLPGWQPRISLRQGLAELAGT